MSDSREAKVLRAKQPPTFNSCSAGLSNGGKDLRSAAKLREQLNSRWLHPLQNSVRYAGDSEIGCALKDRGPMRGRYLISAYPSGYLPATGAALQRDFFQAAQKAEYILRLGRRVCLPVTGQWDWRETYITQHETTKREEFAPDAKVGKPQMQSVFLCQATSPQTQEFDFFPLIGLEVAKAVFDVAEQSCHADLDRPSLPDPHQVDRHQAASELEVEKKSFGSRWIGGSSLAAASITSGMLADGTRPFEIHSHTVLCRRPIARAKAD